MPAKNHTPHASRTPIWDGIVDEFPLVLSALDPLERRAETRRARKRRRRNCAQSAPQA